MTGIQVAQVRGGERDSPCFPFSSRASRLTRACSFNSSLSSTDRTRTNGSGSLSWCAVLSRTARLRSSRYAQAARVSAQDEHRLTQNSATAARQEAEEEQCRARYRLVRNARHRPLDPFSPFFLLLISGGTRGHGRDERHQARRPRRSDFVLRQLALPVGRARAGALVGADRVEPDLAEFRGRWRYGDGWCWWWRGRWRLGRVWRRPEFGPGTGYGESDEAFEAAVSNEPEQLSGGRDCSREGFGV